MAFLKQTMNVVDCLAIAPYYITLFFMPPPNIDLGILSTLFEEKMNEYPKDVASSDIQHQTDEELESVEEEEDSGFGNAGRIMQV